MDAVADGKIDETKSACYRDGGLASHFCQGVEPVSLPPGQNQSDKFMHLWSVSLVYYRGKSRQNI